MLRLNSILTLQNVWETLPPQPSKATSPTTLSRASSVRTKPASIIVSTTELPPAPKNQQDTIPTSGSSCLPASLHAPPVSPPASVHSNNNASSHPSVPESSTSAALSTSSSAADAVPSIQITHSEEDDDDEEDQRRITTSSMFETSTKNLPPTKKSQSSPTSTTSTRTDTPPTPPLPSLPSQTYPTPPPPVPNKDSQRKKSASHHDFSVSDITNINNEADDAADKMVTTKSGRYHFLGPRSSAASTNSPPSSIRSSITGANKALRRESSKINMRRKSFSKKLKKAISNIKLNGTDETTNVRATISN